MTFYLNALKAVSLNEDVDTNKELVAHGYSNFLSGLFGTVYDKSSKRLEYMLIAVLLVLTILFM